ncbi:hypothetical protein KSF78_0008081 [Schistosoma japonicum]|nr:hypothetical protein KSF78_0008081 [Schistosoma japonicum]
MQTIIAESAYELGLVHRVVKDGKLHEASIDFTKKSLMLKMMLCSLVVKLYTNNKRYFVLWKKEANVDEMKLARMLLIEAYAIAEEAIMQHLQIKNPIIFK